MAARKSRFRLEKTWRGEGIGQQTYNAPGNHVVPYGKQIREVEGRGGTGNSASGGNFAGNNPGNGGNTNAGTPGNPNPPNPYQPGNQNPGTPGNPNPPNPYQPGLPYYDKTNGPEQHPGTGGNPTPPNPYQPGNTNPGNGGNPTPPNPYQPGNVNPYQPGNPNYNPYQPAQPGNPATLMGITMPGSNSGGSPAPYQAKVLVSRYTYPADGSSYPVTCPSGGYITVTTS